jgi:hypothetical protein
LIRDIWIALCSLPQKSLLASPKIMMMQEIGAVANNGSDLRRNWKVACRIRPFPSPDDPLSAANEDLRFRGDAGMVKVGGSAGAQDKSKYVLLCSCAAVRI